MAKTDFTEDDVELTVTQLEKQMKLAAEKGAPTSTSMGLITKMPGLKQAMRQLTLSREKASDAGKRSGESRKAAAQPKHKKIISHAQRLKDSGREEHELASMLAPQYGYSKEHVRNTLKDAGVITSRRRKSRTKKAN